MSAPPPITRDPNPEPWRVALHAFYGLVWWVAIVLGSVWWVGRSLYDPAFRRMCRERLGFGLPAPPGPGERQRILIHGVSVGEVKAAQALVASLERECPHLEVVFSTVTDTGMAVATELYRGRLVVRFPVEPGWIVERFLRRLAPVAVVLVELEIWPNFLRATNQLGIPVAVVNGRITERSFRRYERFRNLLPQFNRISLYCVQGEEYGERFRRLGVEPARVVWTGNVKADSLGDGPVEPGEELRRLLGGRPGQLILTAGSTHADEELLLGRVWRSRVPEARLVLVPRHPQRAADIAQALREVGLEPQRLSALRAGEAPDPARPALVDTIGELERVYGLSDLVYVGGTLVPHGGQNMLEPAAQGRPVLHGPHVDNFQLEARLLAEAGGSLCVRDAEELGARLAELAADPARRARMASAGLEVVRGQKGATARTLRALRERCLDPLEGARNGRRPL